MSGADVLGRFVDDCATAFQADPLLRPHAGFAFERLERIGVGGMGTVYRVRDHRAGREAALKVLQAPARSDAAAERKARRFIREARVTAGLDHPAIPPVYEYGRSPGGELFILMKLIRGQTLGHRIQELHRKGRSPRGVQALIRVLARVCDALGYAHEQGVIHRDIKPDNIMIGEHGEVYLMDWGLARDRRESEEAEGDVLRSTTDLSPSVFDDQASVKGGLVGTFGYMAPEQALGRQLTPAADLFSIGAILYQILTGEPPVVGDGFVGVAAILDGRVDLSRQRLAASPALIALVRASLAAEPARRPASADELAERLRAALQSSRLRPELILAFALIPAAFAGWLAVDFIGEDRRRAAELAERDRELADIKARVQRDEKLARELERAEAAKPEAPPPPPPLSAEKKDELKRLLDEAITAYRAKDYETALARYRAALTGGPYDIRILPFVARVLIKLERFAEARDTASRSLEIEPTAYAYFQRSSAFKELGEREKALDDLDRAIELEPDYFTALLSRASILMTKGRHRDALADLNRMEALGEDLQQVLILRGQVHGMLGDPRASLADLDRAKEMGPLDPIARAYRGFALTGVGRLDEARQELDQVLKEDPPDTLRRRIEDWKAQMPGG